jgi:HPt (histidine-containing phosphotransfer) domain-containing protein
MPYSDLSDPVIYSKFGEDPELIEVIEIFVSEMPDRTANMHACYERSDWAGLRQLAHQLRGAAGSYGFQSITELSARLEAAVVEMKSPANIRRALEDLSDLCGRIRSRRCDPVK